VATLRPPFRVARFNAARTCSFVWVNSANGTFRATPAGPDLHDYGDICQAITEVAVEQHLPITTEEFHTLNRCLDTAIAAVTEHARITV
jgi:hypothetical protein